MVIINWLTPCRKCSISLKLEPIRVFGVIVQGYYRRADAYLGLGKMKKALADFRKAASVAPRDPDLRKKLQLCEKEVKRIRFEEALATPVSTAQHSACSAFRNFKLFAIPASDHQAASLSI